MVSARKEYLKMRSCLWAGEFHFYVISCLLMRKRFGEFVALITSRELRNIAVSNIQNEPSRDDAAVAADSFSFECPVWLM